MSGTEHDAIDQEKPAIDADNARPDTADRDIDRTRSVLAEWLATKLGPGASPEITEIAAPSGSGMSSETLLVDASWIDADGGVGVDAGARERCVHRLVVRVAPEPTSVPVFPTYDLVRQFETMRLVAQHSDVAVPNALWVEADPTVLGGEFFVMERVDGQVPPDVLPYNFGSWVTEASDDERARLQRSAIGVLADLHAIPDASVTFELLAAPGDDRSALRAHVDATRDYYEWVAGDGYRHPLLEAGFDWLEAHWPDDEGPTVLSWGDARIGNMMFRDFEPVAVLDWEMAALAPPEVDLAWTIFLHRFFEDIAAQMELPGLPAMFRRAEVEATYAELSGHTPHHMDWHTAYAALRHGVVMARVQRRPVHYGQTEMPADPDDLVMHRATIEEMLAGTYWDRVGTD